MNAKDEWRNRAQKELDDLRDKLSRAKLFNANQLGDTQKFLLLEQIKVMTRYADVLQARISCGKEG